MKSFDVNRFGRTLRYTLIYNIPTFTKITLGWFIGLFVFYFFSTFISVYSYRLESALGSTIAIFFGFFAFTPSWILSNMRNKQTSLDYLMLPASNLEKFLARIICVSFLYEACFFIAFLGADVLQWILSLMKFPLSETGLIAAQIYKANMVFELGPDNRVECCVFVFFALVWGHAIYTLGGVIFRKRAWVITSLIMLLLTIVVSNFIGFDAFDYIMDTEPWLKTSMICVCVFLSLSCLNYYLAFQIFKHMQLVNNKWINI